MLSVRSILGLRMSKKEAEKATSRDEVWVLGRKTGSLAGVLGLWLCILSEIAMCKILGMPVTRSSMFHRITLAFELRTVLGGRTEARRWLQLSNRWTRVVMVNVARSICILEIPRGTDAGIS